jgi:glycosyltransferase involved in cell wall biosynthesis
MRILMCHKYNFPLGGAERYLLSLRQGLVNLGHTVIDFSTLNPMNIPSTYSQYFVKSSDLSTISHRRVFYNIKAAINFIYSMESRNNIERLIEKFNPDVAHIHNIYHHLSSSILTVLRRKKIPVVMTLHDYKLICPNYSLFTRGLPCQRCRRGSYCNAVIHRCLKNSYGASMLACLETYFNKIFRIYENSIDLFIAPSVFLRDTMLDFGMDGRKVRHVPYSVDLEGFAPDFSAGKYILYVGSLSDKKGVQTLLKCAARFKNTAFKIIGDGPQKEEFKRMAVEEKARNIEFLGYKQTTELPAFIRHALFVVVPSEWYEITGLTVYEAFACGKCVVASDTGGIPELVENGRNGLLFRPGDADDLAAKIAYLMEHRQNATELGRNAYEKISRVNNVQSHCRELLSIYNNLITGRN